MDMTKKDKKPIVSLKKIQKSDNEVTRIDQYTFYVKSSNPKQEPYFVYKEHMNRDRWLCDCMHFTMMLTDDNHSPDCKHILRCKELG